MTRIWNRVLGVTSGGASELDERQESFNLAICRILYFSIVLLTMANTDYFLRWREVPEAFWFPRGLYSFFSAPISSEWVTVFFYVWQLGTLLCAIGFFYRWVAPVWWLSCLLVTTYGHSFGYQGHVFMPVVLAGLPLALAQASRVISIDSWLTRRFGKCPQNGSALGDRLSIRSIQVVLVLAYFAAGVAKLRHGGLDWMTGETLRNYLFRSSIIYSDINALAHLLSLNDRLIRFPLICNALAFFAVLAEVTAPAAFFWRRASYIVLPLIVLLQVGIFFTMYVRFTPYLALVAAWINWYGLLLFLKYRLESVLWVWRDDHA